MIKLFAWQAHTIENIEKARNEEMRHQKRSRILQVALWKANELMPVLSKIVVIALYVCLSNFITLLNVADNLVDKILYSKEEFRGKFPSLCSIHRVW